LKGSDVFTPPLSSGCLAGITRELLLEWGLAVEGELSPDDLHSAEEVFVTSSTRDVHPVVRLGARSWDEPGEVTRHIAAQYVRSLAQNIDP
jgi:branched-chain amino acid aminotransferase